MAIAVSVGFFSGPVVKQLESQTTTLGTSCIRFHPSSTPNAGSPCMRTVPPRCTDWPGCNSWRARPSTGSPASASTAANRSRRRSRLRRRASSKARSIAAGGERSSASGVGKRHRRVGCRHHRAEHLHAERSRRRPQEGVQQSRGDASPIVIDVAISGARPRTAPATCTAGGTAPASGATAGRPPHAWVVVEVAAEEAAAVAEPVGKSSNVDRSRISVESRRLRRRRRRGRALRGAAVGDDDVDRLHPPGRPESAGRPLTPVEAELRTAQQRIDHAVVARELVAPGGDHPRPALGQRHRASP